MRTGLPEDPAEPVRAPRLELGGPSPAVRPVRSWLPRAAAARGPVYCVGSPSRGHGLGDSSGPCAPPPSLAAAHPQSSPRAVKAGRQADVYRCLDGPRAPICSREGLGPSCLLTAVGECWLPPALSPDPTDLGGPAPNGQVWVGPQATLLTGLHGLQESTTWAHPRFMLRGWRLPGARMSGVRGPDFSRLSAPTPPSPPGPASPAPGSLLLAGQFQALVGDKPRAVQSPSPV